MKSSRRDGTSALQAMAARRASGSLLAGSIAGRSGLGKAERIAE